MKALIAASFVLIWPALAAADMSCPEWQRLDSGQKTAAIEGMIEGHVGSNAGKRFTNENRGAMRRCLQRYTGRILDDMNDICSDAKTAGMDAIDDVFDRYLVSCVR